MNQANSQNGLAMMTALVVLAIHTLLVVRLVSFVWLELGHWPTLFSSMSLAAPEGRKPDSLNLVYLRQQGRGLEKKLEVFFRTFCFQFLYVLVGCTSLHFLQLTMSRTAASRVTFVNPGPEFVAGLTTSGRINLKSSVVTNPMQAYLH